MRRILIVLAVLLALPATASANSVLSPGELSIGAEFFPERGFSKVSESAGLVARYALSSDLALLGTFGLMHRIQDGRDPPTFYAIGGGAQYQAISSKLASVFLRGGVQFIPRAGREGQVLGVRLYAGPGVEARLTEAFSLQFMFSMLDLQIGGVSTDFDLGLLPAIGGYLYF